VLSDTLRSTEQLIVALDKRINSGKQSISYGRDFFSNP